MKLRLGAHPVGFARWRQPPLLPRRLFRPKVPSERSSMLRRNKELTGSKLAALDGEIGHVKDIYFDDQSWTVRYLVADTGHWLPDRRVLLSPFAVSSIETHPHKAL